MESTAADAMPDDTDLTHQAPEPEQAPEETSAEPATAETNPVMELALKDLQQRRDALEAEVSALSSRKQQLEAELKANFAGQSDAIAATSSGCWREPNPRSGKRPKSFREISCSRTAQYPTELAKSN